MIFFYGQITERRRFSLGRETKLELNSLASGFSLSFHQIKLQEEKLLKIREKRTPRSTRREVRPKLRAGGKGSDGGGDGGGSDDIPWRYTKMKVFSTRYKSDKSNQRVYNISDISSLDPNLSKKSRHSRWKIFPFQAREDHRSHISVMGQRAYNLTSACQERNGGVTVREKKTGRLRERARDNERRCETGPRGVFIWSCRK